MSKQLRIIIADDHAIVRKGIVQIIKEGLNFPLIQEVDNAESLYSFVVKEDYDLAIVDITFPGRSGLDALLDIKKVKPGLPVLILSINSAEHYGLRALKNGASGYIMKDAAPTELIQAINQVLQGKKYISNIMGQKLIESLNEPVQKEAYDLLSDRELEVFKNLAKGMPIKDIADKLSLSVTTVSTYRARILEKMNFSNNADIIHYAIQKGLV